MLAHGHDLWHNGIVCPLNTKDLGKLLEVLSGCLPDGKDSVAEPTHAQTAKLLIEKLDTQLRRKEGNVFDDGKADAPLLVLSKLYNGREK